MLKQVAKFEKVSFEQFEKDMQNLVKLNVVKEDLRVIYDRIKLPKRATRRAAGHDFWLPFELMNLQPGGEIIIPSGIRCIFEENENHLYSLDLYPRSGHGFKYKIRIKNTVGIIDDDYSHAKNEGHIMVAIANEGDKLFSIKEGDGFCQGLFHEVFIAEGNREEDIDTERIGGTGSTDK